jgi:hypothetical protein
MEKVNKHHFLFRVEGRADPQHFALGGNGVEVHFLGLLGSLKAASRLGGGVGALIGQLLHVCDKRLVKCESLNVLNALDIAVKRVLDRRAPP